MVCSRGESHTHHTNQMKLFNAIAAAAAVIGTTFVAATPSEARCGDGFIQRGNQCFATSAASKEDKEIFCRSHTFQYGPRMVSEDKVSSLAQYFDNCMSYTE